MLFFGVKFEQEIVKHPPECDVTSSCFIMERGRIECGMSWDGLVFHMKEWRIKFARGGDVQREERRGNEKKNNERRVHDKETEKKYSEMFAENAGTSPCLMRG